MANYDENDGINRFYSKLLMLQSNVIESQSDVMKRVAKEMAITICRSDFYERTHVA
jgi:hypothetical protein